MDRKIIEKPFPPEDVKTRPGGGGKQFSYVPIGDVTRRVLEATDNAYAWEVVSLSLHDNGGKRFWLCHGRLTIDGHHTDGIGTQDALDLDSPKGAESDSFKRCAMKRGCALSLYEDDAAPTHRPAGTPALNADVPPPGARGINNAAVPCEVCNAPSGKPHATSCTR